MKSQASINVSIVKPANTDELNRRYTEAVFKVIKNKISVNSIDEVIEKLKSEANFSNDVFRRDSHESSSNL